MCVASFRNLGGARFVRIADGAGEQGGFAAHGDHRPTASEETLASHGEREQGHDQQVEGHALEVVTVERVQVCGPSQG